MARPKKEVVKKFKNIAIESKAFELLTDRIKTTFPDNELSYGKIAIHAIGLYCNLARAGKLEKARDLVRKALEVK